MSLPPNYTASGIVPHIIIYDSNWQKRLEYIHEKIDPNGTRDFYLKDWKISGGINSDAGSCSIIIEDHDTQHTLKIKPDWFIQIYLYREQEQLWFTGIIIDTGISRDGYNQQTINVSAYGYAHGLTNRFVDINQLAYEGADGIESSAAGIKISELAKFALHDDAMLIPPADPNITQNIEDLDITLPSFSKENQSQSAVLAELANIAGAVYGIDPNLEFYFRSLTSQSPAIITNDDLVHQDPTNLYILRNQPYTIRENAVKKSFTNLIGLDVTLSVSQYADNEGTNAIDFTEIISNHRFFTLFYVAQRIGTDELDNLQVWVVPPADRSTITEALQWKVGTGSFNPQNTYHEGSIPVNTLKALSQFGGWVSLGHIDPQNIDRVAAFRIPKNNYTLVSNGTNTAQSSLDNAFRIATSTGSIGSNYNGNIRLRSTSETQTTLKAQNTTLKKTQRDTESMEYLADRPSSDTATTLFEGILNEGAKVRRIYSPVIVSVNNNPPPLGKRVKFIDNFNGLNTNPVLIGYDIRADHRTKLEAINLELELEQLV